MEQNKNNWGRPHQECRAPQQTVATTVVENSANVAATSCCEAMKNRFNNSSKTAKVLAGAGVAVVVIGTAYGLGRWAKAKFFSKKEAEKPAETTATTAGEKPVEKPAENKENKKDGEFEAVK